MSIATGVVTVGSLVALLVANATIESIARSAEQPRVGPIVDPTQTRLLAFKDLAYEGAFRLPATESNGDSFAYGGGPLAFRADRHTLFVGTRTGRVAEISIPAAVATALEALPVAEYVQGFRDPAEGNIKQIADDGAALAGLLVYQQRLYGSGLIYYDANHTQSLSHFWRPLDLTQAGASAVYRVGDRNRIGLVAGYMAVVPPEWESKLGGPAITGQCCIPIVSRTSWGPAAFSWDPGELGRSKETKASPLVFYTGEHPTLGHWENSNPVYGGTIQMGGVALVAGTRTALFVGRNGTGPYCYGEGTSDRDMDRRRGPGGEQYCYDPASSDKGQHAYPYRYQIWAYDLNDWAAVRAGDRDPWEVKPYGVWPFELPYPEPTTRIGGVAYDPERQRLYVSQLQAERDTYVHRAVIHVFRIQ